MAEDSGIRGRVQRELAAQQAARERQLQRDEELRREGRASAARAEAQRHRRIEAGLPLARLMIAEVGGFVGVMEEHGVKPTTRRLQKQAIQFYPGNRGITSSYVWRELIGLPKEPHVRDVWILTGRVRSVTRGGYGSYGASDYYYESTTCSGLAVDPARKLWKYTAERGPDISGFTGVANLSADQVGTGQGHGLGGLRVEEPASAETVVQMLIPDDALTSSYGENLRESPIFLKWQDHLARLAICRIQDAKE